MKKLTLTFAVFCLAAGLIYAGPEPIPTSGKEMKEIAPAPAAECFNWSGFYLGVTGGYKFASVDTDLEATGDWNNFPFDRDNINNHGGHGLDTSGFEAGGLIGYNYQWKCWVFGAEVDGGYLWLRDSYDTGTFPTATFLNTDKSIQTAFRTHYLLTAAPRLGISLGRWLPYVTAGLAVGDLDFEQRLHNVPPNGRYFSAGEVEETQVGWMVGGGLQYALTDRWIVRSQYEFIDLGSVAFDADGSAPFTGFSTHNSARLREHNSSWSLIFKF